MDWKYIYNFLLHMLAVYCYNIDEENYLIFNGKSSSRFGFSSALLKSNDASWLLAGAPKDNFTENTEIISPGNVYKCRIDTTRKQQSACEEMTSLRTGEPTRKNERFSYEENNQLLGANLLVTDQTVVTCSSLWKNVGYEHKSGTNYFFPVGFCFEISKSNLSNSVRKRFQEFEQGSQLSTAGGFIYGFAQIGFSVAQIKGNPVWDIVFGAPGINDGKGGFVFSKSNKTGTDSYSGYKIKDNSDLATTVINSAYVGYSIDTGKFGLLPFPLVVIGSPRFSNKNQGHIGGVFMLITPEGSNAINNLKTLSGEQPGSGFGASLCVADINGDGKDDLLVGAPYFTYDLGAQNFVECGKVYIYYGTGDSSYTRKQQTDQNLLGMKKVKSRFGIAITNIGDINADSFNDIAIGAPYEDDMSGAVYIYNGRKADLDSMYSQRISGQRFTPALKSFGMQISSSLDIDNNQYSDFAVGAYMSDRTVILRTRPIVNMTVTASIVPDVIPLNSSGLVCSIDETKPCVSIILCFSYAGIGVDEGILIDFMVKSDTIRTENKKSSRLQLYIDNTHFSAEAVQNKVEVNKGAQTCKAIVGRVQTITKEFFRSIADELRIEAEFKLSNESMPGRVFPILNEAFTKKVNKSAYFEKECEDKCKSNLNLEMTVVNTEVIVGQTEEVVVRIRVQNTDQPSYATTIFISTSNNTEFLGSQFNQGSVVVTCKLADNVTNDLEVVQCDINKPFYRHHLVDFQARFNVSIGALLPCDECYDDLSQFINITATAETQGSTEVDPSDNKMSYNVPIKFEAILEINGISTPEQHKLNSESEEDLLDFTHEYSIYNTGPSPLPSTNVILDVPVQTPDKVTLIERSDIFATDTTTKKRCKMTSYLEETDHEQQVLTTTSTESTIMTTTGSTTSRRIGSTIEPRRRKKRDVQPLEQTDKQIITNMTCENYGCAKFECSLDSLDKQEKTTFKIEAKIKKSALPFGKNDLILRYKTKATVKQPKHRLFYPWNRGVWYETYIDFFPEKLKVQPTKINIWIIVGGCLGGLALIILLGIILWRCGFFKRKRGKEFKEWKRQSVRARTKSQRSSSSRSTKSTKWEPQEVAKLTKASDKANGK